MQLVAEESYTRRGQRSKAEWIVNFAKLHSIGNARIVDFPDGAEYANEHPRPCNVVIDIGEPTAEDLIVFHGHLDTVPLDNELIEKYGKTGRNPLDLIQDNEQGQLYRGLGAYDMLGSVGGMLAAMNQLSTMKLPSFRRVRLVIVCGEENDSEGTHAAFKQENNLFAGASGVVSTEIAVNATLSDEERSIVVARPGRMAFDLKVFGDAMHIGAVTRECINRLLPIRLGHILPALPNIEIGSHPNDPHGYLKDKSMVLPKELCTTHTPAITVAGEGTIRIEVPYTDPALTTTKVHGLIHAHVKRILGSSSAFELQTMKGRVLPFTKPWLEPMEDPNRPFVSAAIDQVYKSTRKTINVIGGRGVADEGIIANHPATAPVKGGMPVICLAPDGTAEHTEHETLNMDSIDDFIIPGLVAVARNPKPYRHLS